MECGGDGHVPVGHWQTAGWIMSSPACSGITRRSTFIPADESAGYTRDSTCLAEQDSEIAAASRKLTQSSGGRPGWTLHTRYMSETIEDMLIQRREKMCDLLFGSCSDRGRKPPCGIGDMQRLAVARQRRGQRMRVTQRKVFRFGAEVEVERVGPEKLHTEPAGYTQFRDSCAAPRLQSEISILIETLGGPGGRRQNFRIERQEPLRSRHPGPQAEGVRLQMDRASVAVRSGMNDSHDHLSYATSRMPSSTSAKGTVANPVA
jgi:hypothetical protein